MRAAAALHAPRIKAIVALNVVTGKARCDLIDRWIRIYDVAAADQSSKQSEAAYHLICTLTHITSPPWYAKPQNVATGRCNARARARLKLATWSNGKKDVHQRKVKLCSLLNTYLVQLLNMVQNDQFWVQLCGTQLSLAKIVNFMKNIVGQ